MATQKIVSGFACLLILVLAGIVAIVWFEYHKGSFRSNSASKYDSRPLDDNSISFTISSPGEPKKDLLQTSATENFKDLRNNSYIENVGSDANVEIIKPRKLGPVPLHVHDIIFDKMNNYHGEPSANHNSGHFRHRQAEIWDPHPKYEIIAFGEKMFLDLSQDDKFIAPNLHVHTMRQNFSQKVPHDQRMSGCFYTGKVQGDADSDVVVSLCHGMTGYIRRSDGMYYIEPAENFKDGSLSTLMHKIKKVPHQNNTASNEVIVEDTNTCTIHEETDNIKIRERKTNASDQHYPFLKRSLLSSNENVTFNSAKRHKRDTQYLDTEDYDGLNENKNVKYYIKVMVVADKTMVELFKDRETLSHYILTLMSQTHRLYKHSSIGNPVYVTVKAIKILEHVEFGGQNFGENKGLLQKFCEWSHKNGIPNHSDVAILLTRNKLCDVISGDKCATIGLAKLRTACTKNSCAIAFHVGLSTTYVIAHEIGHVLSLTHDSDAPCKNYNQGMEQKYIMDDSFKMDINPWMWSPCSSYYLREYLKSKAAKCLLRPPNQDYIDQIVTMPGKNYNLDQQCELEFGEGSVNCVDYQDYPCGNLWCQNESGGSCTSQYLVAEGTSCGDDSWCRYGKCVPIDENDFKPVNGGWGPWSEWEECSRTCGGGITIARRECNNPIPENGGDYCLGTNIRYASCNTHDCLDSTDFRAVQCSKFNGQTHQITNLTNDTIWLPKYGLVQQNMCQLFCRPKNSQQYYKLEDKVIDGTKCDLKTFNVCVNGKCKPAGCDNKLGSNVGLDHCGICGGDNSGCKEISGSYNATNNGYHRVLKLPKGILNLDIKQRDISTDKRLRNYLALWDPENKRYILNGINNIFEKPTDIEYGNSIVKYSGSDEIIERIYTEKNERLTKDLILEILSVDMTPPDVTYRYFISKSLNEPNDIKVCRGDCKPKWDYGIWSECSRSCGGGVQKRSAVCVNNENDVIDDELCNEEEKLVVQVCNDMKCPVWVTSEWTACSTKCGPGQKSRMVKCQMEGLFYNDKSCDLNVKPSSTSECYEKPCVNWKPEDWSQCSVTCGHGIQTREIICRTTEDDKIMDSELCADLSRPTATQRCNSKKCYRKSLRMYNSSRYIYNNVNDFNDNSIQIEYRPVLYKWVTGPWGQCSKSCGGGVQSRMVLCRDDRGNENAAFCYHMEKPVSKINCNAFLCPKWVYGNWSACDDNCEKHRSVFCQNYTGAFVHDSSCDLRTKLTDSDKCPLSKCPHALNSLPPYYFNSSEDKGRRYRWSVGKWKPCSSKCGKGMRYRNVTCEDTLNDIVLVDQFCRGLTKPRTSKPCERYSCSFAWIEGTWSSCSSSCGLGIKKRNITCHMVYPGGLIDPQPLPDIRFHRYSKRFYCDIYTKPKETAQCKESNCADVFVWKTGPWKKCSHTCGKRGRQVRQLNCVHSRTGERVGKRLCARNLRPKRKQKCNQWRCAHKSCKDVKLSLRTRENKDYLLRLNGRKAVVYCFKMDTREPEEYISLQSDTQNFAELYDKRLIDLDSCPADGERMEDCNCIDVGPDRSGFTKYYKVRLNITSMRIIGDDYTFVEQIKGTKVPYGTAGDCYSMQKGCGQGRFSIDLTGTSFRLSQNVQWVHSGFFISSQIIKNERGATGKCGGFCGKCIPDISTGLTVEVT